eukprot:701897-Ditylum_brightwellii.AAC.1
MIPIKGRSSDKVEKILGGKHKLFGKINPAYDDKVAVMPFQHSPAGVPRTVIIAALPQSNNESNDFINIMENMAVSVAHLHNGRLITFAVDAMSAKSQHVWMSICCFLSCKINHTGTTDPNHNAKSWRTQLSGGGQQVGCTIGKFMVDSGLFHLSDVSSSLWRPDDFSSDLLILKLFSFDTIKKVLSLSDPIGLTSSGDKVVLALTSLFIRIHLRAVNGKSVPASHHVVYLRCTMLYFTSIQGASIITKRNIVSETISFMFNVLRKDVPNPCFATSEPIEHIFGQL